MKELRRLKMTPEMISLHRGVNESSNIVRARLRSQRVSWEHYDYSDPAVIRAEGEHEDQSIAFWDLVHKEYGDIIENRSVSAAWGSNELVVMDQKW